jgi:hypothetical protein
MKSRAILAVAFFFALASASTLAVPIELGYGTHQVSETVQINDDLAYVVHMSAGDRLEVSLQETTGKRVDFYLTNLTAYLAYRASLSGQQELEYLYYLSEGTSKDTTTVEYQYTTFIDNTLVVMIDNGPWTEGGAAPTGPVSVDGTIIVHKNVWTAQNIIITILVVAVIIAFMVGVWLPRK